MFIYAAFKSHKGWSNVPVSAPTTIILPTTVNTFQSLNCFGRVIYMPQTSTYQNIEKLLTHPRINNKYLKLQLFIKDYHEVLEIILLEKITDFCIMQPSKCWHSIKPTTHWRKSHKYCENSHNVLTNELEWNHEFVINISKYLSSFSFSLPQTSLYSHFLSHHW